MVVIPAATFRVLIILVGGYSERGATVVDNTIKKSLMYKPSLPASQGCKTGTRQEPARVPRLDKSPLFGGVLSLSRCDKGIDRGEVQL